MFVRIGNTPRDYAWGSTTEIAGLLGTTPSGHPEAELWLGAHPGSPSAILDPSQADGAPDLAAWIDRDPSEALGVGTIDWFASKRRNLRHCHFGQRSSHKIHPSTNSIDPPAYQQIRIGKLLGHKAEVSQRVGRPVRQSGGSHRVARAAINNNRNTNNVRPGLL